MLAGPAFSCALVFSCQVGGGRPIGSALAVNCNCQRVKAIAQYATRFNNVYALKSDGLALLHVGGQLKK